MNIYLVVKVESLKLVEPSMLTKVEKKVSQVMPSIDNLSLNTMNELYKDSILQNKVHTTRRGDKEI